MTLEIVRTVVSSSFDDYLTEVYGDGSIGATRGRAVEVHERQARLENFPHSVVLQVAYPELDFANRWCWVQFGAAQGECLNAQSEYPACNLHRPHAHEGKWLSYWLDKVDYDFGYNEWCFTALADLDSFLQFIPHINWGERYPK
jgi:hypothetical protein